MIISVVLLFYVLGVAAIGGVAFMVLSVPLGKWTTKKTQAFQKILMARKDDRMSVVGETMQVKGVFPREVMRASFRRTGENGAEAVANGGRGYQSWALSGTREKSELLPKCALSSTVRARAVARDGGAWRCLQLTRRGVRPCFSARAGGSHHQAVRVGEGFHVEDRQDPTQRDAVAP